MKKLHNITGHWDMSYNYNFNTEKYWEGQILLYEDGWFEGIVVEPNSSYKENRFVFGVYHKEKIIELFKFTPIFVSAPFVFHGINDKNAYNGQFEIINMFGTKPCGVSKIIIKNLEKEITSEDIKNLEEKIENYKTNVMDEVGNDFYTNTYAIKNSLSEIILRKYENKPFEYEEIEKILEECAPVNERIKESMEKDCKILAKKLTDRIYE